MKKYDFITLVLFLIILSLSSFALGYITINKSHHIKITKIIVNDGIDKGTISVLFTDNDSEYGLDFITYKELNELLNQ